MSTTTNLKLTPLLDQNGAGTGSDAEPETGDNRVLVSGISSASRGSSSNPGGVLDLGNGSDVMYVPKFLSYQDSWNYFEYLNKHIPWTRPIIRVFGRSSVQPRDVCYVADEGLPNLVYSGYQPCAHSWDEFPPLRDILGAVLKALPGSRFNSLLLNRYKGGSDYVSWHADDEKVYGATPEIASVSFGCERDFLLKRKPIRKFGAAAKKGMGMGSSSDSGEEPPPTKRSKKMLCEQQAFTLKHGSLLVMRGYTQRDWLHSVPKRAKAQSTRINLTFRLVISSLT